MYKHKNGIILHKITQEDLNNLYHHKLTSWWGTHTIPLINYDDQTHWFENLQKSKTDLCLAARTDALSAGYVLVSNIDWLQRKCSVSAGIFNFGKEQKENVFVAGIDFIFEMLNMHRIEAEVLETNLPAQKLEIDLLQFRIEGLKREAVYKCGKYYNSLVLGMLRSEWRARSPNSCNQNFSHEVASQMIEESRKKYENPYSPPLL